jgi:O-antigen/teichoic acid export membrane protein
MKVDVPKTSMQLYQRGAQFFFSKFARASAWLVFGTLAAGTLGYVFQILMGRMLKPLEYGLFSAMMGLFTVLAAPSSALMMVISRKVSQYRAEQGNGSITHFYYWINIRSAIFGLLALGIFLLYAPQIQLYMKTASIISVYLLGVLVLTTFMPVINNAFLQGTQSFVWLSALGPLWTLLKIIFSSALVFLGFGVSGALGGTILAALVSWIISYYALHHQLAVGQDKPYRTQHLTFKPMLPVLFANVAFASMTQLDIVLVNYYFSGQDTGFYAAASILGKAVMYLSGGIAMALFPMVAELHTRNESSLHLLFQAVGLTAVLSVTGAIFYFLFGEAIIVLFFGEEYRSAGIILKFYGFAMLPMALVVVVEHFLIAKGRVLFSYLFILILPLQLILFYFYHDTLLMVLKVVGLSSLLILLLGFGLLWRSR